MSTDLTIKKSRAGSDRSARGERWELAPRRGRESALADVAEARPGFAVGGEAGVDGDCPDVDVRELLLDELDSLLHRDQGQEPHFASLGDDLGEGFLGDEAALQDRVTENDDLARQIGEPLEDDASLVSVLRSRDEDLTHGNFGEHVPDALGE